MPWRATDSPQWGQRLARIERKRRLLARLRPPRLLPRELLGRLTWSSFAMEQLDVTLREAMEAIAARPSPRAFRRSQFLRIRHHAAALRGIERAIRRGQPIKASTVVHWYTSISCGLSVAAVMDAGRLGRIDQWLRRINSPHLLPGQAIGEAAAVHAQMLGEAIVPGFNGILCRLLLQFHLARCGLAPVTFDPDRDRAIVHDAALLARRLIELVEEGYDWLLARAGEPRQ